MPDARGRSPGRRAADLQKDPEAWVEQEASRAILMWAPCGGGMWEASVWIGGRKRWWQVGEDEFFTAEEIERTRVIAKERFGAAEKSLQHPDLARRRPELA